MKNTDCVIYLTTKRGRTWTYLKEGNSWTQTGPSGKVHRLSAEQLLSHLLPPLAADNPGHLSVRVERRAALPPRAGGGGPKGSNLAADAVIRTKGPRYIRQGVAGAGKGMTERLSDLISLVAAGKIVGRTNVTVWRWIQEGRLKAYRVADRLFVSRREVTRLLSKSK